jgi:hypothetical protein
MGGKQHNDAAPGRNPAHHDDLEEYTAIEKAFFALLRGLRAGITNAFKAIGRVFVPASRPRYSEQRRSSPPPLPPAVFRNQGASALAPRTVEPMPDATLPFARAPWLVSPGERAFWHPLYHAVKGRYRIFCKVRLADVVKCGLPPAQERVWFRKIGRFHVDFVICDPETTEPLLVIELDDRKHRKARAVERDKFKNKVLADAKVPVLRVRAQQAYAPSEIEESIQRELKRAPR